MPGTDRTVAQPKCPPTEQQFHLALCDGLLRAARKLGGKGALADALDMTDTGLRKIFNGSVPNPKRLFDALAHDEGILDEIVALYGRKIVPMSCAGQKSAAPPIVAALHKVIEAEMDGVRSHIELLGMEQELCEAEKVIAGLRQEIADIRKPRMVN